MTNLEIAKHIVEEKSCKYISCDGKNTACYNYGTPCPLKGIGKCISENIVHRAQAYIDMPAPDPLQKLFDHMSDTYGLTLVESEMHDIIDAAGLVSKEQALADFNGRIAAEAKLQKIRGDIEMNLTSCDSCGVVLDADKLPFSDDFRKSDGSIDIDKAAWNGDEFVSSVKCPCCGGVIIQGGLK